MFFKILEEFFRHALIDRGQEQFLKDQERVKSQGRPIFREPEARSLGAA